MSDSAGETVVTPSEQSLELRKEAFTMALYVAVCLLAVFIALPEGGADERAFQLIWGVSIGLSVVHVFAFGISARLVGAGAIRPFDVQAAGAQVLGAAAVAVLASIPVLLLPQDIEIPSVEFVLSGFVGLCGFAVARVGGASRPRALVYAGFVLVVALLLAGIKNFLAGH